MPLSTQCHGRVKAVYRALLRSDAVAFDIVEGLPSAVGESNGVPQAACSIDHACVQVGATAAAAIAFVGRLLSSGQHVDLCAARSRAALLDGKHIAVRCDPELERRIRFVKRRPGLEAERLVGLVLN